MARVRTFVAVSIVEDVVGRIERLVQNLSRGVEGVKWVPPDKLHFTLKFLGEVEDIDLHEVCTSVAGVTQGLDPFDVLVAGAGAFPSTRRPRTVWVGASTGQEKLIALQKAVDRPLRKLGFPRETRRFTPHVTVGRIRQGNPTLSRLTEHLLENADCDLGVTPVDQVCVFSSELRPDGPEYHVLGRAPLGREPAS